MDKRMKIVVMGGTSLIGRKLVNTLYFGAELNDRSLVPSAKARLAPTHFADWLSHFTAQKAA